jgi:flagellar biosynthetic protein FliR
VIDLAFVTRLGLLLVRPGALVLAAPPFGGLYTPAPVKIGLSVILAVAMAPLVAVPSDVPAAALGVVLAREMAIGLALAFAVRILMAGAELGGQLAGFQLGFAYAATVDPNTGARNNVLASLYSALTLFTFLGLNAHHALLRAVAESYRAMPIGVGHLEASLGHSVASLLGLIFVFGTQVAAPVVIVLLLVELGVGLISRAAPALNLMVIGFPLRLLAGLIALAATIAVVPSLVARLVVPALELAGRLAFAFR